MYVRSLYNLPVYHKQFMQKFAACMNVAQCNVLKLIDCTSLQSQFAVMMVVACTRKNYYQVAIHIWWCQEQESSCFNLHPKMFLLAKVYRYISHLIMAEYHIVTTPTGHCRVDQWIQCLALDPLVHPAVSCYSIGSTGPPCSVLI